METVQVVEVLVCRQFKLARAAIGEVAKHPELVLDLLREESPHKLRIDLNPSCSCLCFHVAFKDLIGGDFFPAKRDVADAGPISFQAFVIMKIGVTVHLGTQSDQCADKVIGVVAAATKGKGGLGSIDGSGIGGITAEIDARQSGQTVYSQDSCILSLVVDR